MWVLGGLAEDMVDLGLLAVAHRGRGNGRRLVGILVDLDIEGVGDKALGRAKGADDDSRMDRLGRYEELGGNLLLGL